MDPFAFSKVIKYLLSKLRAEFETEENHDYDVELNNLLRRAENHISSDHVRLFSREAPGEVRALIDPSYGSCKTKGVGAIKSYPVQVSFDEESGPTSFHCQCPVGNYVCSHIVAVLLFAQKIMSRTDFGSVWNRPVLQKQNCSKRSIAEIWTDGTEAAQPMKKQALDNLMLLTQLADQHRQFGLYWLIHSHSVVTKHENTRHCWESFEISPTLTLEDKICAALTHLKMTNDEIRDVCELTIGQAQNPYWLKIRRNKLTASTFGSVLKAMKRKAKNNSYSIPPTLFKKFAVEHDLTKVKSIKYGIDHELDGIKFH